jgi:hypothetical protein
MWGTQERPEHARYAQPAHTKRRSARKHAPAARRARLTRPPATPTTFFVPHVSGVSFQAPLARARVPTARPGRTGPQRSVRPRAPIVRWARLQARPAVTVRAAWRATSGITPPRRACLRAPHVRQASLRATPSPLARRAIPGSIRARWVRPVWLHAEIVQPGNTRTRRG